MDTIIRGLSIFLALAALAGEHSLAPRADEVQELLRNRIESAGGIPVALVVAGERIHASSALPTFYEQRAYRPAWSDGSRPLPVSTALLEALGGADAHGLHPADYHHATIERLLGRYGRSGRAWTSSDLVDLDLLATDAFLIYASHLLAGRVDPVELDPLWIASRRERDLVAVLDSALASGRIVAALESLLPPYEGYRRLRQELARHRQVVEAGGWSNVPDGPKLARGERGPRVAALRARLAMSTRESSDVEATFDESLERDVMTFQRRHGLEPDGVVGPATLAALNVSAQERLQQIELNMERWRWLPQDLGDPHIIVNIAGFELDVVEGGSQVLTMRVVAGRPYRRTPVFSDRMTYLVLSPYWHVPRSLAVQDILPQIKKDPAYLQRQGMTVFRGNTQEIVDPATIDWSTISATNFPFRLRQNPGPNNALGDVKFMFPNQFNVYLHDTPSRTLFERASRDFSSGCIRVQRPLELAEYLLRGNPGWTEERLRAAVRRGSEETVSLPRPVPVHLLYWTSWAEPDGSVQFRPDIYGRDAVLAKALDEPPPSPRIGTRPTRGGG